MIDIQTLGLVFLEGLGFILSPCILPVLPIILAAGVQGGRKRPFGIIVGFIIAFSLFTLISRQLILWLGIDSEVLRQAAYILLMIFGVILCSTKLSEEFSEFTQHVAMTDNARAFRNPSGFFSGVLVGATIGLIWVPCAGPILAAVIVQTATQGSTLSSFLTLLSFSVGVSIPMLIITFSGQQVLNKLTFMRYHAPKIRKFLGVVIIVTVLFSSGWLDFIKSNSRLPKMDAEQTMVKIDLQKDTKLINGMTPYPAPEMTGIDVWINSEALSLASLKDKVILLDFWTYSCINCVRTIPHLNELYKKYHSLGLEIIGIHSPEFAFEQKLMNVSHAIESHDITYPVALDNQFLTWKNYNNQSWPAQYLIDKKGNVVYLHVGEGGYDVIENNIRYLLGLGMDKTLKEKKIIEKHGFKVTPETYLGHERMSKFQSLQSAHLDEDKTYSYPPYMRLHHWALKGNWHFSKESITAKSVNASLTIRFFAKKIFVVMGTENETPINITLKLNGQPLDKEAGSIVKKSEVLVNKQTLYEIAALPQYERGELEIISQTPGLQLYAFTFG